jgi:hypothetical protein
LWKERYPDALLFRPITVLTRQMLCVQEIKSNFSLKKTTMKRTFFLLIVASAITFFSISSCQKPEITRPGSTTTGNGTNSSQIIINRTASSWVRNGGGFYVSTFKDIIPYGRGPVKVYLVLEDDQIQINNFTSFKGGQLWAAIAPTDLILIFRYSGDKLPFESLDIKVVID